MSQRAFFFVIVSASPRACDWLASLLPRARSGPLVSPADAAASVAHKAFFEALCACQRVVCAVGNEWLGALPRTFRGLAAGQSVRGLKVLPRTRAERTRSLLEELRSTGRKASGPRGLSLAQQLMLCEPWDFFALWLSLDEMDFPQAGEKLGELLAWLTPDIAVCGVLLSGKTGVSPVAGLHGRDARATSAASDCRWFWRLQKGGSEPLPTRPVEDVLPSLLSVQGINAPPALPGTAMELQKPGAPSGYTPEDERAIQKRLEDLGYL